MLLKDLASKRLVLVGGKGGVGKTTVAAALALYRSRLGERVLLVSTDPAHNLGHLWGCRVGAEAQQVSDGLLAMELDPARAAQEHLAAVGQTLRRMMPEHLHGEVRRHLESAAQAPGTHEAALLESIADIVADRSGYDSVILDTAPSGHTARLVTLPESLGTWTDALLKRQESSARFGRALRNLGAGDTSSRPARRDEEIRRILVARQSRFASLRSAFTDDTSAFVVVLAAERLPVEESVELSAILADAGISTDALVVNKRSPAGQGEFLAERRRVEDGFIEELRRRIPGVPLSEVALQATEPLGDEGLTSMIEALEAQPT